MVEVRILRFCTVLVVTENWWLFGLFVVVVI